MTSGRSDFDVAIIGAGHNGLVCASYLARAGLKVGLFERRPVPGGAAVTEPLWPGFAISRASYMPSIRSEIVEELGLRGFGLTVAPVDPEDFVPFPDGRHLFVYQKREETRKEIERFSPRDAQAFERLVRLATQFSELVDPLMLVPPPSLADLFGFAAGPEMEEAVQQFCLTSCKDLLNEQFESEPVRAALCMRGILNTSMGVDSIGTSYILALTLGRAGYHYAVGGTGAVSLALARCLESGGGNLALGQEVERIRVEAGRAVGIELVSGKFVRSKIVVSNADPKRTFLGLIDPQDLDEEFRRRVQHLKSPGTSLKVNLALDAPLDFSCLPGQELGPQHRAHGMICPTVDYAERAHDECKWGRIPREPPLSIFSQTAWDPSVAPPGKHTLSIIAKYMPYRLASGGWENAKEEALGRTLDVLEAYVPRLRRSILHVDTLTPLDLEQTFGLTEGNVTHLDQTLNQMLSFRPLRGWSKYRTPVDGLYLCGAGTHPGGGVTGAPGHNAALAILEDWPRYSAEVA